MGWLFFLLVSLFLFHFCYCFVFQSQRTESVLQGRYDNQWGRKKHGSRNHTSFIHTRDAGEVGREGGRERESVGGRKEKGRKVASKLYGGDVHPPRLLLKFL